MQWKILRARPGDRIYAIVLETGDDVIEELKRLALDEQLEGAWLTAIGAFSEARIAFFDWESKAYEQIEVGEQVEVLSLSGNVAMVGERPRLHTHVVLGRRDGSTLGGHLTSGRVRPTLEVRLVEAQKALRRQNDAESGLDLLRFA